MGWLERHARLSENHPGFRRLSQQFFYQGLGLLFRGAEWTFMNYGYAPLEAADQEAGPERYCASLYRQVAAPVSLSGAVVLDVGCGRGGGAAFVMSQLGPASVVGLDRATRAVALCRRIHHVPGLSFVAGDAEALPFPPESFDAVLNIESSHCYSSIGTFFSCVRRVLRPGGWFLFADQRPADLLPALHRALAESGLTVVHRRDITANVARALREDHARRTRMIERMAPRVLRHLFQEFSGVENSAILRGFESGACRYVTWALSKPAT